MVGTARPTSLLLVAIFSLATAGALAQSAILGPPTYSEGDRWEYLLDGRVTQLEDLGNFTGLLEFSGLSTASVTSSEGDGAAISWATDLTVSGTFSTAGENGTVEAAIEGFMAARRKEHRDPSYFLPVQVEDTTEFDLTLTLGFTVSYAATIQATADVTPGPSYPTYPVDEGEVEFDVPLHIESNVTVSFFGVEARNESTEDLTSRIWMDVSGPQEVSVPAGTFQAVRVETETLEGVGLGPFPLLFEGARQIAYHSEEVKNPVLFRFLSNETEVGNATLRSFSLSEPQMPLLQQPLFIGVLLAVPAALLLYLYWRERRKGL